MAPPTHRHRTPASFTSILCWVLLVASSEALMITNEYRCVFTPRVLQPSQKSSAYSKQHHGNNNRITRTALRIGSLMGNSQQDASLPRDVKDAVSRCKEAVQAALQEKCSRMDIEMYVLICGHLVILCVCVCVCVCILIAFFLMTSRRCQSNSWTIIMMIS